MPVWHDRDRQFTLDDNLRKKFHPAQATSDRQKHYRVTTLLTGGPTMTKIHTSAATLIALLMSTAIAHAQPAGSPPQLPLSYSRAQQLKSDPAALRKLQSQLPPVAVEPGPRTAPPKRVPGKSSVFSPEQAPVAAWSNLANTQSGGPYNLGNPLLLTDGTVIVHRTDTRDWYKLTPDNTGSYINGTWTQIASMQVGYGPKFHASAVLPDGRVIVEGGEYNLGGAASWGTQGSIYDPVANTWTAVSPPSGWTSIGDAQSTVLPNGTFFLADCCSTKTALFDATNLTWTSTGSSKADWNDEESWTLLPNGKVLTVDAYVNSGTCGTNSELYDPSTGAWSSAGNTPSQLSDCNNANTEGGTSPSYEIGPSVLMYNSKVIAFGGTTAGVAATALFNTSTATWAAGANLPSTCNAGATACTLADAPAVLQPNGNVLYVASHGKFHTPAKFFEYDPTANTHTAAAATSDASSITSFYVNFVILPTGQILAVETYTSTIQIYTPSGTYNSSWQPVISSVPTALAPGSTYQLSGTQLNGLSQGSNYGDDQQAATNYPLVRITNNSTGHIFYARTAGHSTMTVAANASSTTNFKVPAGIETGASTLVVVANGIPSQPVSVTIASNSASLQVSPSTNMASSGPQGGPFSPSSFQYQLSASSGGVNYSITNVPNWLDVSSTSGTVTTSPTTIAFTLNSNANRLAASSYVTNINFNNTTNNVGNTSRTVNLSIALPLFPEVGCVGSLPLKPPTNGLAPFVSNTACAEPAPLSSSP
jgi:hypothetical protein